MDLLDKTANWRDVTQSERSITKGVSLQPPFPTNVPFCEMSPHGGAYSELLGNADVKKCSAEI